MSFKLRALTLAVATLSAVSAHSAGLDRSGQDITGFLQDGTYADVTYTKIDADVSGKDTFQRETGDIAPSYDFFRYTAKTDLNDTFSLGILYDEPFGASVEYTGNSAFVANANAKNNFDEIMTLSGQAPLIPLVTPQIAGLLATDLPAGVEALAGTLAPVIQAQAVKQQGNPLAPEELKKQATAGATSIARALGAGQIATTKAGEGTKVEIHTKNITTLLGAKFGQNKNLQVYAGPAFQQLEGEVHLRGSAYKGATAYDAQISPDTGIGWVAGVAYSKPEIALKASLTYRSEIEHETGISETFPARRLAGLNAQTRQDFKVTLPESINFDFQTGLSAKHRLLGTARVRYVPWGDFSIQPNLYMQTQMALNNGQAFPIVSYSKDQWVAELGLAKQVNDKLAVSGTVGWDSGAGNPATTLGPIEGYYSVGLGAKYNITPNWALSAGAKYLKFGDATAQLPDSTPVGEFSGNDGYIVGLKLSYQQK